MSGREKLVQKPWEMTVIERLNVIPESSSESLQ